MVVPRGLGEGGTGGKNYTMGKGFYCEMVEMLWNQIEVTVVQHCEDTKCHQNFHSKVANFVLCKFYHKNYF